MKKTIFYSILGLVILSISGCAPFPQNPIEYRKILTESQPENIETYTVKRSYKSVLASLKKNSTETN